MRALRRAVGVGVRHGAAVALAAVAALAVLPSAVFAGVPFRHAGPLLPPTLRFDGLDGGGAMGQAWAGSYARPTSEERPPCLRVGRHSRILVMVGYPPATCVVDRGTPILVWGYSATCDDTVPGSEFYAVGEVAQRTCAYALLQPVVERILVHIDGGRPVDLHRDRFGIFMPHFAVVIPPGEEPGPSGPATFSGYGWTAWLIGLPPGRHFVRSETRRVDEDEPHVDAMVVDVRPGRGRLHDGIAPPGRAAPSR